MDNVVLTFGICSVVVVDSDSKFMDVFEEMCSKLNIVFWSLSRGNHKGLSVERYHRFLNKTQTIAGNERGTHLTILQNAKLSQYAWNSAPIDNTDVVRSLAAVGREFRLFADVELNPSPKLNDNHNSELYHYLRQMSNNGPFVTAIIQILAEERRRSHRERHNNSKTQQVFQVGDAVTARVTVQSKADLGTVAKLAYKAKGPFQITAVLGADSYEVQKYGDPTSAKRKYKGIDLFLLPPVIFPSEPLETTDYKYLNYDYIPLIDPLQKFLSVDMHNDTYFSTNGNNILREGPFQESPVDVVASKWHNILPTVNEMHIETNTTPPPLEIKLPLPSADPNDNTLLQQIQQSLDKVLFIKFLPRGMMRPKWYAVQIDMQATEEANPNFAHNNLYWCIFLMKHPQDKHKSDEFARWWPDWYRYTIDDKTKQVIFGQRVLIRPNMTPSSTTHVQWAELVDLTYSTNTILEGPFNFQHRDISNATKNTIHTSKWNTLKSQCENQGLLPPTLGSSSSNAINTRYLKKKSRKRKKT